MQTVLKQNELQQYLQELLHSTEINFTEYRNQLSESFQITGKDLNSFAKQLELVASKIDDIGTQSRLKTLTMRVAKLSVTFTQPLQKLRDQVLYQLATLEVLIRPLQIHTNQTLEHLKVIESFVQHQGPDIILQVSQEYTNRFIGYLDQFRKHSLNELHINLGKCRPLWNVFDSLRIFACKHLLDPLVINIHSHTPQ